MLQQSTLENVMEKRRFSPLFVLLAVVIHVLGALGVWYAVVHPNPALLSAAVGYFFLCHLAITVGAHRYFTHGAFDTSKPVAMVLATLFSGVAQGSLWWWVAKHLEHHEFEDVPGRDPHTPKDGFFHSHMGWMLLDAAYAAPPSRYTRRFIKPGIDNEVIRWQQKYLRSLTFTMTIVVPALLGWLLGDIIGGLLIIGATRLVVQYHATWVVNSVGHTLGERGDNFATNFGRTLFLPIAAILTVGEAWHANHHRSSAHWRLGRLWYEIDLGAYLIEILALCGLVTNRRAPADRNYVPVPKT